MLVSSVVALIIASGQYKWFSVTDYSNTLGWGDAATYVYVKPWFRIPPYLIGMLTAIFWLKYKPAIQNWTHRQSKRGEFAWQNCIQPHVVDSNQVLI